jgi:hypothetical protein
VQGLRRFPLPDHVQGTADLAGAPLPKLRRTGGNSAPRLARGIRIRQETRAQAYTEKEKYVEHVKVDSSNIESVGYDAATQVLEVRFINGGHYAYHDVPPEVHAEFVAAESIGKHFYRVIRHFRTTKLNAVISDEPTTTP